MNDRFHGDEPELERERYQLQQDREMAMVDQWGDDQREREYLDGVRDEA